MRRRPPTGGAGPEHADTWPQIVGDFTAATRAEPGCLWFGPMYGVSGWSVAIVAVGLVLLVATSLTDALTGIPNRRRLKADLEQG